MKHILKQIFNRETGMYLLFGVLTTVINYFLFWLVITEFGEGTALLANVAAFVASVAFAYITNKIFVFQSKSWKKEVLIKEICSFSGARVLSFFFEEAGLLLCIHWLKAGRFELWGISGVMLAKILLSFVVVLINYVLSKFLIFKSDKK